MQSLASLRIGECVDPQPACSPTRPRLQPHASQPAAPRVPACSPTRPSLQPHAPPDELFDLVVDWPDSLPALDDLTECLRHTREHSRLVTRLRTQASQRQPEPEPEPEP